MAPPLRRVWRSSLSPRLSGTLATPPVGCPALLQQRRIQSGCVTELEVLSTAALRCSHVSGMKIRFLTLIEELRRAGDEVRHVSRTKFTSC